MLLQSSYNYQPDVPASYKRRVSIALCEKAKTSTSAQQEVFKLLDQKLTRLVKKFNIPGYDQDDLLSMAKLSILRTIKAYDRTKNNNPDAVILQKVRRDLLEVSRASGHSRYRIARGEAPYEYMEWDENLNEELVDHAVAEDFLSVEIEADFSVRMLSLNGVLSANGRKVLEALCQDRRVTLEEASRVTDLSVEEVKEARTEIQNGFKTCAILSHKFNPAVSEPVFTLEEAVTEFCFVASSATYGYERAKIWMSHAEPLAGLNYFRKTSTLVYERTLSLAWKREKTESEARKWLESRIQQLRVA